MAAKRTVKFPLVLIFVLAVLVPSIALSVLALRAADRESAYMEKQLEGALLAEVNLTVRRIDELLTETVERLTGEAPAFTRYPAASWRGANPFVAVPFRLEDGVFIFPDDISEDERRKFVESFGPFLLGEVALPVYDSLARVYRRELSEMATESFAGEKEQDEASSFFFSDLLSRGADYAASPPMTGSVAPPAPPLDSASGSGASPPVPAPSPSRPTLLSSAPKKNEAPAQKRLSGVERQMLESSIAADEAVREQAFEQVEREGFEIAQRNVLPQASLNVAPTIVAPEAPLVDDRSGTVSRSRTLAELTAENDHGLLPRERDDGLALLFWSVLPDGGVVGCTIDMPHLRDRVVDAIPGVWSKTRILNVLDEAGTPLVDVAAISENGVQDWRRPFVAMEISPLLPRWEAGAWLADPGTVTNRAESVRLAIWLLVAGLFVVIAVGGFAVIRMVSIEARVAAQKTTFVASVSHELKTPLTSIRLFAELLMSGRQTNEGKRNEYLRTMVSETERLSRLVENVLSFSRKDAVRPKSRLDLAGLAEEVVEQLHPHLERAGFVVTFSSDGSLPVAGNREELKQVLMNLLSNAEKYSGETCEIGVLCRAERGNAVVEIADRGIGIDPGLSEKIFQEFFRADDSLSAMRSGAGLGLSIARTAARTHGGDLTFSSRDGGGSIFTLKLPQWEGETDA